MTTVFVHGVPERPALWDGVRAKIDRESVAVALPGFANARPAGFLSTTASRSSSGWVCRSPARAADVLTNFCGSL